MGDFYNNNTRRGTRNFQKKFKMAVNFQNGGQFKMAVKNVQF